MTRTPQQVAAAACERARLRFNQGNKGAILDAVYACATVGVPLPEWAATAFVKASDDVKRKMLHASWDDVFGIPHLKGEKLPAKRNKAAKMWPVWLRVLELRQQQPGRDHFDRAAQDFKISVALAKEYFYEAQKLCPVSTKKKNK